MHLLFVIRVELNPSRKPYNRRGGESGCTISQANTQKTAVKARSPQRGAEGDLDSGIFPSPAPCKKADGSSVCFFVYNEVGIEHETQAIQSERGRIWVYPTISKHPENHCQGA